VAKDKDVNGVFLLRLKLISGLLTGVLALRSSALLFKLGIFFVKMEFYKKFLEN
jgi:hypothetical protein